MSFLKNFTTGVEYDYNLYEFQIFLKNTNFSIPIGAWDQMAKTQISVWTKNGKNDIFRF